MPKPVQVSFVGGDHGPWNVESLTAVAGPGLKDVARVDMVEGPWPFGLGGIWLLRGVTSNERYVERRERDALVAAQAPLGRPEATAAALIAITKSQAWWDLAQDERRAILEGRSHHIAVGLNYLPAIARRLAHGRDRQEDFDFLTWFEFAPSNAGAFNELLAPASHRGVVLRRARSGDPADPLGGAGGRFLLLHVAGLGEGLPGLLRRGEDLVGASLGRVGYLDGCVAGRQRSVRVLEDLRQAFGLTADASFPKLVHVRAELSFKLWVR